MVAPTGSTTPPTAGLVGTAKETTMSMTAHARSRLVASLVARLENQALIDHFYPQANPSMDLPEPSEKVAMTFYKKDVATACNIAHTTTSPAVLEKFSRDPRVSVRRAVANNPHHNPETRKYLFDWAFDKGDEETQIFICFQTPPLELLELIDSDPELPLSAVPAAEVSCRLVLDNDGEAALAVAGREDGLRAAAMLVNAANQDLLDVDPLDLIEAHPSATGRGALFEVLTGLTPPTFEFLDRRFHAGRLFPRECEAEREEFVWKLQRASYGMWARSPAERATRLLNHVDAARLAAMFEENGTAGLRHLLNVIDHVVSAEQLSDEETEGEASEQPDTESIVALAKTAPVRLLWMLANLPLTGEASRAIVERCRNDLDRLESISGTEPGRYAPDVLAQLLVGPANLDPDTATFSLKHANLPEGMVTEEGLAPSIRRRAPLLDTSDIIDAVERTQGLRVGTPQPVQRRQAFELLLSGRLAGPLDPEEMKMALSATRRSFDSGESRDAAMSAVLLSALRRPVAHEHESDVPFPTQQDDQLGLYEQKSISLLVDAVPASRLLQGVEHCDTAMGYIVGRLTDAFGDNLALWDTAVQLAADYEGSLTELIEVACAVNGIEPATTPEPEPAAAGAGTSTSPLQLTLM